MRRPVAIIALLLSFANSAWSASANWREVAANGTWPEPRFSHTATLTADREYMLLFGGNNFDAVNELFAFHISRREWFKLKPSGAKPSKRYGHQSVVTANGRMIIFGGYNGSFLSDVHELTVDVAGNGTLLPSWRRVETTGEQPSARDGHSAVLAPDGVTMLVYGGFDGKNQLDDLFALDTSSFTWSRPRMLPPKASSSPQTDEGTDAESEGDDAAAEQTEGGDGAASRDEAASSEAADGDAADSSVQAEAASDATTDAPDAPPARYQHSAVGCPDGMLVYGGYLAGGDFADDLWRLTIDSPSDAADTKEPAAAPLVARWSHVRTTGDGPGGSYGHAAAADAEGRHMWLAGGFGNTIKGKKRHGAFSNSLHVLDTRRNRWARVPARGQVPSPRQQHSLVTTGAGELLLFGGNEFGPARGFYSLDTAAALAAATKGASPAALTALLLGAVQLVQLLSLILVALASWLRRFGLLGGARCAAAVAAALAVFYGSEQLAPPPGALLARALGRPKPSPRVPRRTVIFERSRLSTASDVAAAVAAAGLASLVVSAGGPPMRKSVPA